MRKRTQILTILTFVIIISAISILINDLRDFNFQQFKEFTSWARTADKNESWFTSQNAIKWSFYAISAGLFFWRAYLIFGFTYFFSILGEIKKENYFSDKIISSFKKMGNIFIVYTINVFVLQFILALVGSSNFNLMTDFREELTYLIPAGLAFYILAEIFKRAKMLQQENDLTI